MPRCVSQYRSSNEEVCSALLPQLTAAASTLPALFARVDRLLDYASEVEKCCDALEQRVAQAEAAYTPQKATTVAKLFSSLRVCSPHTPPSGRSCYALSPRPLSAVCARCQRKTGSISGVPGGEGGGVVVSTEPIGVVSADDFFHVEAHQTPPR